MDLLNITSVIAQVSFTCIIIIIFRFIKFDIIIVINPYINTVTIGSILIVCNNFIFPIISYHDYHHHHHVTYLIAVTTNADNLNSNGDNDDSDSNNGDENYDDNAVDENDKG